MKLAQSADKYLMRVARWGFRWGLVPLFLNLSLSSLLRRLIRTASFLNGLFSSYNIVLRYYIPLRLVRMQPLGPAMILRTKGVSIALCAPGQPLWIEWIGLFYRNIVAQGKNFDDHAGPYSWHRPIKMGLNSLVISNHFVYWENHWVDVTTIKMKLLYIPIFTPCLYDLIGPMEMGRPDRTTPLMCPNVTAMWNDFIFHRSTISKHFADGERLPWCHLLTQEIQ